MWQNLIGYNIWLLVVTSNYNILIRRLVVTRVVATISSLKRNYIDTFSHRWRKEGRKSKTNKLNSVVGSCKVQGTRDYSALDKIFNK